MPLTAAQQDFLDRYIRKHPFRAKGKSERAKNFAAVRDRALLALQKLAGLPAHKNLKTSLEAADAIADQGKFNEAADAMAQVAADCEQTLAGFDPTPKLKDLGEKIKAFGDLLQRARDAMDQSRNLVANRQPALRDGCDVDPALAPQRGDLDAATHARNLRNFVTPLVAHAADCRQVLRDMKFNNGVLELLAEQTQQKDQDLNARMKKLDLWCTQPTHRKALDTFRLRSHSVLAGNPAYADLLDPANRARFAPPVVLTAAFVLPIAELEQAVDALEAQLAIWQAQLRLVDTEVRNVGSEIRPAALAELAGVQEEMTLGAGADRTPPANPPRTQGPVTFDTGGFLAGCATQLPTNDPAALGPAAGNALKQFIAANQLAPGGDELFDLSLRSPKELEASFCVAMGWNPRQLSAQQTAAAAAAGKGLFDAMREVIPDKLVTQGQAELKFGGKTYGTPELLGKGGMGQAMRYTDPSDGSTIVVKSLLNPANRDDMAKEIRVQRYLMGGQADAVGREHVLGLKGAVTDEHGNLHTIMEVVDGGDLEDNRMGQMVASMSNALPEQARSLLQQQTVQQAVKGLIYLRDQNLVHFDVKGANIFMDAQGNAKVADFGSSSIGTSDDGTRPYVANTPLTPGYAAPEAYGGKSVDARFDTYAMGKVIDVMQTNSLSPASKTKPGELTGAVKRLADAMSQDDPDKRPTLEAVLNSSYLRNLESCDPEVLKQLQEKSVAYTKALGKEAATVLTAAAPEVQFEAMRLARVTDPTQVKFSQVAGACSLEIDLMKKKAREQIEKMEDRAATDQQKAAAGAQLATLRARMKLFQDTLYAFGQSPLAQQIAGEMKALSAQLVRPGPDLKDEGDVHALANMLADTARDAPGFIQVVTTPAYQEAFEDAGIDYAALISLTAGYRLELSEEATQADAAVAQLERDVAAFKAGLPDPLGAMSEVIGNGLDAIVADVKLRRQDPRAGRRIAVAVRKLAGGAGQMDGMAKALADEDVTAAFRLVGIDATPLLRLTNGRRLALLRPEGALLLEGWRVDVQQALAALPSRGEAAELTEVLRSGFERLEGRFQLALDTAATQ